VDEELNEKVPELRPEITFLSELVRQLVEGRVRIPRFQRAFVWRPQQMIDLLDSIYRQYPIGSLLAWESDSEIVSLKAIGPIALSMARKSGSSLYLLDGHQRLTTIAGALVSSTSRTAREEDPLWNIYFNAKDTAFEHLPIGQKPLASQFPMSKLLDTYEFINECQRVTRDDSSGGADLVKIFQDVARSFQNYKIPVIQIRETGLTQAVEIFARLNSKGQSMTADQMVSALLYKEGDESPFDLAEAITQIAESLQEYGFGDLDRTLLLRAILGAIGEDIYRTDWSRLAAGRRLEVLTRMRQSLPAIHASLVKAAVYIREEYRITTTRLLPYPMQLVVLGLFFYACSDPSHSQFKLMQRWFWASSFGAWFGSANPSRVNSLVRDVVDNVSQESENPHFAVFDVDAAAEPLSLSFDMRSARTRATLLVLLRLNPRDQTGAPIEAAEANLENYGPESVGYIISQNKSVVLSSSVANRFFRSDMGARGIARGWLVALDPLGDASIFESHAITTEAVRKLQSGDFDGFLETRFETIEDIERAFMRSVDVIPPAARKLGRASAGLLI
jgi:hypothetical protein